jgi:Ni2+-binding GTPase involved in maturation of urease and hydrogenase
MAMPLFVMLGGFLGAGKTAAAVRLAQHLEARGKRVAVITNDQGTKLVDTARVAAAGHVVVEISGGCFCCQFEGLVEAVRWIGGKADVIIAEPVGSCTDLVATVGYPLRQLHGGDFEVGVLSVVVDPIRCARMLGLVEGPRFSDNVRYVYRKQLEEAELLVINKIDLVAESERRELASALEAQFPRARVLAVSCQTGEGLQEWFEYLLTQRLGERGAMAVDYDRYAAGEALLGWVDGRATVCAAAVFDGNRWLVELARRMREVLGAAGIEIGHVKMTLRPDEGMDMAAVSVARTEADPQLTHRLQEGLTRGVLLINVRAEADPEVLERGVREALGKVEEVGGVAIDAFRPGYPHPTHRSESAGSLPRMD